MNRIHLDLKIYQNESGALTIVPDDNINMIDLEEDEEEVPQVVVEPLICPLTEQQYHIFTTLVSPLTLCYIDSNVDEYWLKLQDSIRIYGNVIQE